MEINSTDRKFLKRKIEYLRYELQMCSDTEENKRRAIKAELALAHKLLSPLSLSLNTITVNREDSWRDWTSGQ
jgi:hypothetical protein